MGSPLRILFITRAFGPNAGGMERLSFEMIQAISKLPGLEVKVLAPGRHRGLLLPIERLLSLLFMLIVLPRAVQAAKNADLIHLGDPMLSAVGWLIQHLYDKPITVTIHGLDILYPHFAYQWYLALFARGFDAYFPISTFVDSILKSRGIKKLRIPITPGVSDRFYTPSIPRQELRQILGQSAAIGKTLLFTSGRLVKRKGHAWFITDVLPRLPEDIFYIIAGSGPERASIEKAISQANLSKRVILLGKVSEEGLKILYNTIDAFIQPNIKIINDVEGFGLVLLEAALCRRPIFAADVDGISSAINSSQNGILIKAGDADAWIHALRRYIENPETYQERVPDPRGYTLKNFNWEKTAAAYVEAFTSLAARGRP